MLLAESSDNTMLSFKSKVLSADNMVESADNNYFFSWKFHTRVWGGLHNICSFLMQLQTF
jgi:hypothetical protein